MKQTNRILLFLAIGVTMNGCDIKKCETEGVNHSCSFFPTKTQIAAMHKGRKEISIFLKKIPTPLSSVQYDAFNKSASPNENIKISGNFEGHTAEIKKSFFSSSDPKIVCDGYLSFFQSEKNLTKYHATSCGDRTYSEGKPVYVVNFGDNESEDSLSVFITIEQGSFRTGDSKIWKNTIELRVHYVADKTNKKQCFSSDAANYEDMCPSSYWFEKSDG